MFEDVVLTARQRIARFTVTTNDGSWSFTVRVPPGTTRVELRADLAAEPLAGTDLRNTITYLSPITTEPLP